MGISAEDGVKEILGMNTVVPNLSPVRILASITCSAHLVTIKRVPLQSPSLGAIFRNNIMGHPTLSSNLKSGNPDGLRAFKNSVGNWLVMPWLVASGNILSAAKYVTVSPGKVLSAAVLMAFTSSFRAERIVLSLTKAGVTVPSTFSNGYTAPIKSSTFLQRRYVDGMPIVSLGFVPIW